MKIFQPYFLERYNDEVDHWVQGSRHPNYRKIKNLFQIKVKGRYCHFISNATKT